MAFRPLTREFTIGRRAGRGLFGTLPAGPTITVNNPPSSISRRLYLILGVLAGLGPFSIDMYLPALPEIGAALDASPGTMQMTVTAFLIGLMFGPLVIGPVSDAIGRRIPILVSLVLYSLVSLLLALAGSVEMMIGLRVAQAFCGGTSMSLVRSMIRDLLSGDAMARAMSILMMILLGAPIVAPFFGGALLLLWGWRSIFVVLAAIGALMFLGALRWLPETLPPELRRPLDPTASLHGYLSIVRSRQAVAYAVAGGAAAAVLFSYLAASPFIYIDYYGFDEQWFGALFGISVVGAWFAQLFNVRYVQRIGYGSLVRVGSALLIGSAAVLLWVTQTDFGGLAGVVTGAVITVSISHLIAPGTLTGVLDGFPHLAGSASGFAAFIRFLIGAAGTALVGLFNDGTPRSYGVVTLIFSVIAICAAFVARPPTENHLG